MHKRLQGLAAIPCVLLMLVVGSRLRAQSSTPPSGPPATLDQALALVTDARRHFQTVQDYECTLVKRERVKGELLPENIMTLKARSRPFSVYLRWQEPRAAEGQEVCYVAGRKDGMMRVHPRGVIGVVGFVSVHPLDPRALKDNRHPITQAGMGYLLDGIIRQWERERRLNKTVVRIADCEFGRRPCTWIEITHPEPNAGPFYAYRCVLCLDKATHLPVHSAAYDVPRPGGAPGGDLLESYSYFDVRYNVGLGEDVFNH
jgi:hypothetical protein